MKRKAVAVFLVLFFLLALLGCPTPTDPGRSNDTEVGVFGTSRFGSAVFGE